MLSTAIRVCAITLESNGDPGMATMSDRASMSESTSDSCA